MAAPKVFISYSHDSPAHSDHVLQLADTLRGHGVDAEIDRYEVQPPQGWPRWCEEQLRPEVSDFVLMVCTPIYLKRVQDQVPADEGRGVFWEGAIIYNYLYDGKGNRRFIPILLDGADSNCIPIPVRGYSRYSIAAFALTDAGYQELYRTLTGQPLIIKPPLGGIIKLGYAMTPTAEAHALPARPVRANFPVSAGSPDVGSAAAGPSVMPDNLPASSVSGVSAVEDEGALAIWRRKLQYFQLREAVTSSAADKFELMALIQEARAKIEELSRE